MAETKTLYSRRQYLLEQIGDAADEIKQIDECLDSVWSSSLRKESKVTAFELWVS